MRRKGQHICSSMCFSWKIYLGSVMIGIKGRKRKWISVFVNSLILRNKNLFSYSYWQCLWPWCPGNRHNTCLVCSSHHTELLPYGVMCWMIVVYVKYSWIWKIISNDMHKGAWMNSVSRDLLIHPCSFFLCNIWLQVNFRNKEGQQEWMICWREYCWDAVIF